MQGGKKITTDLLTKLKMEVAEMKHFLRGVIKSIFFSFFSIFLFFFSRKCLMITFGATLRSVDQVLHI